MKENFELYFSLDTTLECKSVEVALKHDTQRQYVKDLEYGHDLP
jgi:hypothetical protein